LYTDGITDARDPVGRFFGTDRLARTPRRPEHPAATTAARVVRAVRAFAGGRPAEDDRTLVVLAALPA
ncbi:MAG TPA: SpoIIE family protein phosphatase, partial [Humisphaera sp.]